jgi:hypothetical protein
MSDETRAEHLAWCKRRALQYVEADDLANAFASMASGMGKHPDTANHAGLQIGAMMMVSGRLSTKEEMRRFIEGFN